MVQTLQVQVEELKSVNESLNLSVEELSKARALAEATLRERDEMIEKILTFETKNMELVNELGDKMKCFDVEKKVFKTKFSKLEKVLAQRVKDFDDVKT
ncbi:hypothetical protein Tco_0678939 [Tanacetum coccineum]|uniref:Uncharacterized protein n=1 Tax=Tanacetum coccineum TaxID=301880 RepID=A0ABQ4XHQ4_9ASTR